MRNRKQNKKLSKFLESEKKLLFYHRDPDGICSAAQILKFYPDFEANYIESPNLTDDIIKEINERKPGLLVFLDVSIDQSWEGLKNIIKKLPKLKIIIIDHHIFEKNLNSRNIIHINPRFRKKDAYLATSYVVYRLLEPYFDVKKNIWIACMGVIGDYAFEECKDLLKECEKMHPKMLEKGKDIFESELAKGSELISSAIVLKGHYGSKKALELLVKSEKYEDFAKNRDIQKWKESVGKEFRRILEDFEFGRKFYPKINLYIYEIKSRLNLVSAVSTVLASKYPNHVILITKKTDEGWKLSFRCQSGKINLGNLVKKCTKGIGSGGGHEKSAGALVSKWGEFKERFVRELEKISE